MEWLGSHAAMIGTVLTAASSYVLFFLRDWREREQATKDREAARYLPENRWRSNQREQALDLLIHETQLERRFETLDRSFPELSAEKTRVLLREVGGRVVTRSDGSEWWHHRSRRLDLINRHRTRQGRALYHPPAS